MPRSRREFLRVDHNKKELFKFLAEEIATLGTDCEKQIVTTHGKEVLCNSEAKDTTNLSPSSREEADTRLILHVTDAIEKGYHRIVIHTVDTDVLVLVLATAAYHHLHSQGSGTHLRYIAAHEIQVLERIVLSHSHSSMPSQALRSIH